MAAPNRPRFRLVYRKSPLALKCVLLAAIVLCTVCLMFLRGKLLEKKAEAAGLQAQAAALQQENDRLTQQKDQRDTVARIRQLALELLELVTPDTVIIQPDESNQE